MRNKNNMGMILEGINGKRINEAADPKSKIVATISNTLNTVLSYNKQYDIYNLATKKFKDAGPVAQKIAKAFGVSTSKDSTDGNWYMTVNVGGVEKVITVLNGVDTDIEGKEDYVLISIKNDGE